jgi:hypothetical protein
VGGSHAAARGSAGARCIGMEEGTDVVRREGRDNNDGGDRKSKDVCAGMRELREEAGLGWCEEGHELEGGGELH